MQQEFGHSTYTFFNKEIHRIGDSLKKVSAPGFEKVPVYDVFRFFIRGLKKGSLNIRATAIAFNFLLALGPALVFFLAMLPYLPISNFQDTLRAILVDIIPGNSYIAIEPLLDEVFMRRGGLPIFGLLTSLFFAQKGIHGIIEAFNASYHNLEARSWYRQRLTSVALMFVFFALAAVSSTVFFFSKTLLNSIAELGSIEIETFLFVSGKWLMMVLITFISISFLYYFGPSKQTRWKFISAGSTLATLLTIISSLGFTYFMNHFAQLNKFFGSIGALVALMLWLNFNAISLLIGFELNASINNAQSNAVDENERESLR
jgi:membrane protein